MRFCLLYRKRLDLEDGDDEANKEGAGEDDNVDDLDPFSDSDD